jgi:hypothetical protein
MSNQDDRFRIFFDGDVEGALGVMRKAYERGELDALIFCLRVCGDNGVPLPTWAGDAASDLIVSYLSGEKISTSGRHANWLLKWREAHRDEVRHEAVQRARDYGVPDVDSFAAASLLLENTRFHGAATTMKRAFTRHRKRLDEGGSEMVWGRGLLDSEHHFSPKRDKQKISGLIIEEESPKVAQREEFERQAIEGFVKPLKREQRR